MWENVLEAWLFGGPCAIGNLPWKSEVLLQGRELQGAEWGWAPKGLARGGTVASGPGIPPCPPLFPPCLHPPCSLCAIHMPYPLGSQKSVYY